MSRMATEPEFGPPSSPAEMRAILGAFGNALTNEADVLAEHPAVLWQQLYNRLQWADDPVKQTLAAEVARRTAPGAPGWLRLRSAPDDSAALVRTLSGHQEDVTCCALSPDGTLLASGGSDGTLRLWDLRTGRFLGTFNEDDRDGLRSLVNARRGYAATLSACVFSPDGALLYAGNWDHEVTVWDVATRTQLDSFGANLSEFVPEVMALSADGSLLAGANGWHGRTIVWDARSGEIRATLIGHHDIAACAFGPHHQSLLLVANDAKGYVGAPPALVRWDLALPDRASQPPDPTRPRIHSARDTEQWDTAEEVEHVIQADLLDQPLTCGALSRDLRWAAAGGYKGAIALCEMETASVRRLPGHELEVTACAFSPDNRLFVSGDELGLLKVWEVASGEEVATLRGHTGGITACAFSPDGRFIASTSKDATIKLWETARVRQPQSETRPSDAPLPSLPFAGHLAGVRACAFSDDGATLISAGADQRIILWDVETGQARTIYGDVTAPLCVYPDGKRIVTGTHDGTLTLWDIETGHEHAAISASGTLCALSPDGQTLLTGSTKHNQLVEFWDAPTGQRWPESPISFSYIAPHLATSAAFAPDGASFLIAGGERNHAQVEFSATPPRTDEPAGLFNRASVTPLGSVGVDDMHVTWAVYRPDNNEVLWSSWDGTLKVWNRATEEVRLTLTGHHGSVEACAYSPDGALILSGGADHTLRLWRAETGTELARIRLPGAIVSIAMHPHRPLVACGGAGGTVQVIDLVGIPLGPPLVTAQASDGSLVARCPMCRQRIVVELGQLGTTITCPAPTCGGNLRLNTFVIRSRNGADAPSLEWKAARAVAHARALESFERARSQRRRSSTTKSDAPPAVQPDVALANPVPEEPTTGASDETDTTQGPAPEHPEAGVANDKIEPEDENTTPVTPPAARARRRFLFFGRHKGQS